MSGQEDILAGYVCTSDHCTKDESKIEVQVEVRVHSISHLLTSEQTFCVLFEFWILEPLRHSDFQSYYRPAQSQWEPSFYEVICFNVTEEIERSLVHFGNKQNFKIIQSKKEYNNNTKIMAYCYLLSLECVTHMNLQNFPLDIQKLMVKLALRKDSGKYLHDSSPEVVVTDSQPPAFEIMKPTAAFTSTMINGNYALDKFDVQKDIDVELEGTNQYIILNFTVKRRWKYYFWGVIFVLILLNVMSLFTLLAYTFDAILTIASAMIVAQVAFLFIVRGMLPKTNTLTVVDKYVHCSFLLDFLQLVQVVVVEVKSFFVTTSNNWEDTDRKALLRGNFVSVSTIHVVFFLYSICCHNAEKKKIDCDNLLDPVLSSNRYKRSEHGKDDFE